jgi:WD40 repeat protein
MKKLTPNNFRLTHDIVAKFLATNGYENTLNSFILEGGDFMSLTREECYETSNTQLKPLTEIVTEYQATENRALNSDLIPAPLVFDEDLVPKKFNEFTDANSFELVNELEFLHSNNILSTLIIPNWEPEEDSTHFIISSSADKSVKLSQLGHPNSWVSTLELNHKGGSVLNMTYHPKFTYLLATCSMDGSVCLTDLREQTNINTFQNHTKFVPICLFNSKGDYFISAGYDGKLNIYKQKDADKLSSYDLFHTHTFASRVECCTFIPDTNILVIGLLQFNYLIYFNCETFEIKQYNMNRNGDNFVSFSPSSISISPTGPYLLVSTNHSSGRMILFELHSDRQLNNYYLGNCDEFALPKHIWHPSGRFILGTTGNQQVKVLDIITGDIKATILAHDNLVRSFDFNIKNNILISGGFDKKVKVWKLVE